MGRAWAWIRIVFGVLATLVGVLFLFGLAAVWFQARSDLGPYQSARECQQDVPACYQTLPGVVTAMSFETGSSGTSGSITVRTARSTEDIAVGNIDLSRDAVHAGDPVEVRYWQGKAMLLLIHGDGFPTVNDPSSEIASTPSGLFLFGFVTAIGALSLFTGIRGARRLRTLATVAVPASRLGPAPRYVGPAASELDPQTVVFRASSRNLPVPWVVFGAFGVVLVGKAALDVHSGLSGHGWVAAIADGVLVVAFVVLIPVLRVVSLRTSRVLVGPQVITLTGIGAKSCDRTAVARIVKVSSASSRTIPIPMALVVDRDNRALLRVGRGFDIDAIARLLGVPAEGNWEPVPAAELARLYPGSVSSATVNATAIGVMLAVVIMAVVFFVFLTFHPGITYTH
ncbi:MAG TPA: hypothetical protein VFL27_06505 [Candidatus Dormibacteraeota bacterium]|nr:hypothetical protein [Candidatus Dormibacteraeota bacterium]